MEVRKTRRAPFLLAGLLVNVCVASSQQPVRSPSNDTATQQNAVVLKTGVLPIAATRRLALGTVVTIEGVVTVPSGTFKSSISDEGFAIQDRSGGIYVRMSMNLNMRAGQRARVTGRLEQHNELLTLVAANADAVQARGYATQVKPRRVATGKINEMTEGRLVRVTGKITRAVVSDLPYGSRLFLDDGSGEIQVYVSASANIDLSRWQPGQRVSVTGLSGQYKDHYEVEPRFTADLKRLF